MFRFWKILMEPMLEELKPEVMVEIGSFDGDNTERILEYSKVHGGVLHAIDPAPRFPADEWAKESQGRMVFHQKLSLEILEAIEGPDLVFLDGDHNYYTVYHELKQIQVAAEKASKAYPVIFFHDVLWPYGRRDQYYDIETVPPEGRQEVKRGGIHPDHDEILDEYGMSHQFWHAVKEGGPKNGVRTAIEDFLKECGFAHEWIVVPGFHGLGVLIPEGRKIEGGFQDRVRNELGNVLLEKGLLDDLERSRMKHFIDAQEAQRLNRGLGHRVKRKAHKILRGPGRF